MQKSTMQIIFLYYFLNLVGPSFGANELAVKAHLDRATVGLNQQFTLHIELSGDDANAASNPQLPKMDHFATYLGSGTSTNMQFINGKMSLSKTISYHFQAIKIGKFNIQPVVVNVQGKQYRTDPVTIEIQKTFARPQTSTRQEPAVPRTGPAEGDLFLRALMSKGTVFQYEPVVVTYKIYTRVQVSSFNYSKLPSTTGFWVEDFPIEGQPRTSREVLDGKQYTVAIIKKMAIFPMKPGKKIVEPLAIECEVRVQGRSRNIFDDFFNDPFGRTTRKRIQSPSVAIDVLPLPEEEKPDDFSGVVGNFSLTSVIDKTNVKTNEAVTLKIKIEGQGNIRTLPELDIDFPADFEVYPPESTESINRKGSVISGSKTYEYVLVPRVSGTRRIKPVQLSIFNPRLKKYKTLETKEIVIDVAKGDDPFIATPTGLSKKEVELLGQDIRFIKTEVTQFQRIGVNFSKRIFIYIVLLLPVVCLIGGAYYRRYSDRLHGDEAFARDKRANRLTRKRLAQAQSYLKLSTQVEFYAEIARALTGYLSDKLNVAEAGMMSEEVHHILNRKGIDEQVVENYFQCLKSCDLQRFSPSDSSDEEMIVFFKKADKAIADMHRQISK